MAGRGDPPTGASGDVPGGDDEYRSVVFDESFVRAARIRELSARERLAAVARGRSGGRDEPPRSRTPRQLIALMAVMLFAFGAAVYLGVRRPYQASTHGGGPQLAINLVALAPINGLPVASDPSEPFAKSPALHYAEGKSGIKAPASGPTTDFTKKDVDRALAVTQHYLSASALNSKVVGGKDTGTVRGLLDPRQYTQFDESLGHPTADGRHEATGWMVRFDPAQVELATDQVRTAGSITYNELDSDTLQVSTDYTFVYALRPTGAKKSSPVLQFAVRRSLLLHFDRDDIRAGKLAVVESITQAGPQACDSNDARYLQPMFTMPSESARQATPAATPTDQAINPWASPVPSLAASGSASASTSASGSASASASGSASASASASGSATASGSASASSSASSSSSASGSASPTAQATPMVLPPPGGIDPFQRQQNAAQVCAPMAAPSSSAHAKAHH